MDMDFIVYSLANNHISLFIMPYNDRSLKRNRKSTGLFRNAPLQRYLEVHCCNDFALCFELL